MSQGYDIKRFLEHLCKVKSKIQACSTYLLDHPNVDFFTREELKKVVADFKQQADSGEFQDVRFFAYNYFFQSERASSCDNSTGRIFDDAVNRARSDVKLRRQKTKLVEDTVLSKEFGATCLVTDLRQFITGESFYGGQVTEQTQVVVIETFPMKWQVKRLDSDF